MKAKELRIGNWVNEKGKQKQVYLVSNHNAKDYFKVKPIPLTEEWLKKFGFNFNINYWFLNHIVLLIRDDYFHLHRVQFDVKIKHVHSLQNLYFALTGKELTIKELIHGN